MNEEQPQLAQLHWENPATHETIFVAQTQWKDADTFREWMREVVERRQSECPEGWMPLVCTETAPMFVKAVA